MSYLSFACYLTLTRSFTASCSFFSFSLNARLLVMLSPAGFRKDAILLNFAVEAFQRGLERLILADLDFRHLYPPSRGLFFEVASYLSSISCILRGPAQNYSGVGLPCQDFACCCVCCAAFLPKAIRKTKKPMIMMLNRLMVRSSRIAAAVRFTAFGPW